MYKVGVNMEENKEREEHIAEEFDTNMIEGSQEEENNKEDRSLVSEKTRLTKKQKIQIGISLVILIIVIISVVLFFLLRGKDSKENKKPTPATNSSSNEIPVNYQDVVNKYGTKLEELVLNYYKQNGKTPALASILEYAKIGDYKISCKEQNIMSDKKIYLGECHVNDSSEAYSYGVKEVEAPVGDTLTVYKGQSPYHASIVYLFSLEEDEKAYFKEIATIPCKNEKCKGWVAFNQYAIVNEENYLYVYDYVNKKYLDIEIDLESTYEFLVYDETLYGIYYKKNNNDYLYSMSVGQIFHVVGSYYGGMGWNSEVIFPLGYVPLTMEDETTNFVNLTTGKTDFSMNQVSHFEIDTKTNKVYILTFREISEASGDKSHHYKVHDSKGRPLFNGEEFDSFYVENGNFVTTKEGVYNIYNSNYQNTYTSKKYSDILSIWNEFILVVDGTNLNLINYQEEVLTTFLTDWSEKKYYYHSMLSGWYTENKKRGIYLVIEGEDVSIADVLKSHPDITLEDIEGYDYGYEYYYIPTTKESGKIATFIGGYAKPVLYLYPVLPTWVTVTFKYPNSLTTTYPKYKNNWSVLAGSNGDLYDLKGNYYYGLYWEEKENHRVDFKEGFYVTKENAISFLEEKLTTIGLNARERNEFIMYWLPILEKNEKSLVYFELTNERNSYSPISINPKPDSMLRMAIHVKKVYHEVNIKEQKLPTFKREGYAAVEWGGVTY